MHYGGHLREAFCDWVEAGMPAVSTVEVNYEPAAMTWERFMRRMERCSDVLPSYTWSQIRDQYGDTWDEDGDGPEASYGSVARWLLRHHRPPVNA
jgi:hypothetical protein